MKGANVRVVWWPEQAPLHKGSLVMDVLFTDFLRFGYFFLSMDIELFVLESSYSDN